MTRRQKNQVVWLVLIGVVALLAWLSIWTANVIVEMAREARL